MSQYYELNFLAYGYFSQKVTITYFKRTKEAQFTLNVNCAS